MRNGGRGRGRGKVWDVTGLSLLPQPITRPDSEGGHRSLDPLFLLLTATMPNPRKRKSSLTIQGPVVKQRSFNSPIVISDDSDDDVRQIPPPRLTTKQKGKARAVPETVDPPRQLRDIDVISIPDDEAPIFPTASTRQTPLKASDRQSSVSVKESSVEFEASSEALPPDQVLEQFKDLFFGERDCSQCGKSIQPTRNSVCSSTLASFLLLTPTAAGGVDRSP